MDFLPNACPECGYTAIAYSKGVIRNRLGTGDGESPVLWCEHCHRAYFQRPFCMTWDRCQVHPPSLAFDKDPAKIDANIKLEYSVTLTPETHAPLYTIYKAPV